MMSRSNFLALLAILPTAFAHMSFYHPSMYGFQQVAADDGYSFALPLRDMSPAVWFLRGKQSMVPDAVFDLPAGGTADGRVACRYSYINGDNPCPSDAGSMHAGDEASKYNVLPQHRTGCALAIAYTSDPTTVRPEDFVVFSVNLQQCAFDTPRVPFQIPENMPPCPNGRCVCAWFWQGHAAMDEMYTVGFNCNVSNAKQGAPLPGRGQVPVKCVGDPSRCVSGPKQPIYWAVEGQNVDYVRDSDFQNKPQYTMKWGFQEGAQNDIFTGEPGQTGGGNQRTDGENPPDTTTTPPITDPVPVGNSPNTPPAAECKWAGHCLGDPCISHDFCSDDFECGPEGKCILPAWKYGAQKLKTRTEKAKRYRPFRA